MNYIVVIAAALLWSAGGAFCFQQANLFSEQVERLLNNITIPAEELATVPEILHDLEDVLNINWPGCKVFPFGSMVTGLALNGSDIDVYALLPDPSVPELGSIYYKAAKFLVRFPNYVDMIPSYSYLTFKYVPTHIKIDLLFNNIEGGRNSNLLRYCLNLDKRIMDLAMIVKYWWIKVQKLSGYKMVPNHGMTVMVFFYLQQVNMLPSVALMQKNAQPVMYRGWNSGFDEIDFKPRNNASLYQLLGGFYEYYNDFNYDEDIISPFVGYPVKRELFKNVKNVPVDFELYRRHVGGNKKKPLNLNDEVYIQDLFQHNLNMAKKIGTREGSPYTTEFGRIARKYREVDEDEFLDEVLSVQIT